MTASLAPVLTAAGMRAADRTAIDDWGFPGRVLMETAGRAAANAITARFVVAGKRVTIVAGHGNNGGDGFVVARVLRAHGATVHVVTTATPETATPDAAANLALLLRLAALDDGLDVADAATPLPASDLVVDALLGTGTSGALREPALSLCEAIRMAACPVVALDLPSGLDADTGAAPAGTVRADLTVAFGALKAGLLLGDGPAHAGEVVVAEIGVPASVLAEAATAHRASDGWIAERLPTRAGAVHKYAAGRALCVAGSRAYTGAAVLSASAALRSGAGAVVACTPDSTRATLDAALPEVMVAAQPETDDGGLSITAYDGIVERFAWADAVLIGCGLGRAAETRRLVQALLRRATVPVVLDADGLTAFAGHAEKLAAHDGQLVLTPHLGELRRLLDDESFVPTDPVETVRALAVRWGAVVVLKGMPSVVGTPDGRVLIGPPPETALATAGAGDVLAGTIAGLLAQGLAPDLAALGALHLGSAAVRMAAARAGGSAGLVASDFVAALPAARAALHA